MQSIFPPPAEVGAQQEEKGQVLDKIYMKVTPTVVVWDEQPNPITNPAIDEMEPADDDVWEELQDAESDQEELGKKKKRTV